MTSMKEDKSIPHRLRERLRQFRGKSKDPPDDANIQHLWNNRPNASPPRTSQDLTAAAGPASTPTPSACLLSYNEATNPRESTAPTDDATQSKINEKTLQTDEIERNSNTDGSTLGGDVGLLSSDIWSAAYREAVDSLGNDIDVAILKGKNVAVLFKELEEIDKEATEESAFLRGVEYLRSLQVPLERFKLALDLASPLTSVEPSSAAVFGVVSSVTAIAISFATADLEFAKQIGEMLEQISYIDGCDTLGQKTNKADIHKALVQVYRKILEFYKAAFEILTKRGAKLVMKMVLETDRLPSIVQDFLRHANNLAKLVQKATWEIVEDIKSMLYDREISRWLGSGRMSQQSQYHASLKEVRADEACEFLLRDVNFVNWYRASESQQLVILGDMGHGKTVSMAFLIDSLSRRSEHKIPQPKLCYYYCRDDETGQAVCILSALILALLEQLSGLKKTFFDWYKHAQASGYFEPATNIKKLEEFLLQVVKGLDRPLFLVIDGLDECDRASRNTLLNLLRDLSKKTPRLKILLSSRPQEEVLAQLADTARIDLASNTERDRVIAVKTVETKLSYLSEDVKEHVIDRLSVMAQGSAIWTRMVVELIERRGIRALGPISRFLDQETLPMNLSKLYEDLLLRCTSDDPDNYELATTAIKLLAVTRRPLSILELSWAVALGAAPLEVNTVAALAQLVDHQRLMSLIQPFVSRVDFSDLKKRQVILVHQSVKEFIVDHYALSPPHPRDKIASIPPGQATIRERIESLESHILDICIRYLLLEDIDDIDLFSEEQVALENLPQISSLFDDDDDQTNYDVNCTWEAWEEDMIRYNPAERGLGELFVYASCHWIDHFGTITLAPLPNLEDIENLCRAGSTRLNNWIEQNCRPDCAINPRFEFDSSLYDPLAVTASYGSEAMLQHMLATSDFDNGAFFPDPVTEAAIRVIRWGELSRLSILLFNCRVGDRLQMVEFFRLLMGQWADYGSQRRDWNIAFDIVDDVVNTLVREQLGNELLCVAARRGCMPLIRRLMTRARDHPELRSELLCESRHEEQLPFPAKSIHQSIGEAILRDHVEVVEYLLGEEGIETHLHHINSRGENVLHLASNHCDPAMFRLLVPRFLNGVHQKDNKGDTPLVRIIKSLPVWHSPYESAEILLQEGGGGGNSDTGDERHDPLCIAVQHGNVDMCSLLICVGRMDPLSVLTRHDNGQLVLKDASSGNGEGVEAALRLLRAHANAASGMANPIAPLG